MIHEVNSVIIFFLLLKPALEIFSMLTLILPGVGAADAQHRQETQGQRAGVLRGLVQEALRRPCGVW